MSATVKQRGEAWYVYVNFQGRRMAKSVGSGTLGREAAKLVAKKVNAQLALGDLSFLERRDASPSTLTAYAERWLETAVKGRLKIGTYEFYESTLRRHWRPCWARPRSRPSRVTGSRRSSERGWRRARAP